MINWIPLESEQTLKYILNLAHYATKTEYTVRQISFMIHDLFPQFVKAFLKKNPV